jgi:cysteine desulfurase/selenocysteine lyase
MVDLSLLMLLKLGSAYELLQKVQADAICSSAHKMYSASLGIMVVRKDFVKYIDTSFVGGGMVADVHENEYDLLGSDHIYSVFEPGLQAWGEIIALKTAIDWLQKAKKTSKVDEFAEDIFEFLKKQPGVETLNKKSSPVISFYHKDMEAHMIAKALSDEGIMVRSGYFCCHYYLKNLKKLPHLVRISIGLHNKPEDVEKIKNVLERIFN